MTFTLRLRLMILLSYAALLTYGTWFPIDRWDWELGGWGAFLAMDWPTRIPRSDLVINIIVYVPFGVAAGLLFRRGPVVSGILAAVLGFLLSSFLELGQTYLPGRVTSATDIALNTISATLGAVATGLLLRSRALKRYLNALSSDLRHPGIDHLGLIVLALWVFSQWSPWVPTLDFGNLKQGLAPFRVLGDGAPPYFLLKCGSYFAMLTGLMALGLRLFNDRELAARWLVIGMFVVLLGKVPIVMRQLSPEALLAAVLVAIMALQLRRLSSSSLQALALVCLLAYHALSALTPEPGAVTLRNMNWIPFKGQMNSVTGIVDLVGSLWLFAGYAYLMYPKRRRTSEGLVLRLLLVAPLALLLEWAQQNIPGRYPGITDVVAGIATFVLAYSFPWRHFGNDRQRNESVRERTRYKWRRALVATGLFIGVMVTAGQLGTRPDNSQYALPEPEDLRNPRLPSFRYRHPRLPAPGKDEWELLREGNPGYIERKRGEARAGSLYASIMMARTEPGTVDLDALFNKLLELEFTWRGHEQTIPIALAYDWLYDRWTPTQRALLLTKAEQACAYQIHVIRNKLELSPYNVYLYNSPLQALMMAAIAIYGDTTDGQCMRFTHDYWKNRVLPVWSQVMGRNGGWHEGGEYVGIGIGQAVHRLPAMWRKATGEDLFVRHAGIRGFPDFALQRKRPDGTIARLGDIAFVKKGVPDLAPLALELRHAAAYTAANPPQKPTPMGYPWGPMSDNSLIDPAARSQQPLAQWFDGIGLLVARSGWDKDATYLTVKAGNNYWSHMHLDQGAFTIYKGGALAIDSGVYFDYGGEHHLNYTYQSIAHNVVTVTDPNDTALLPGKEKVRDNGDRYRTPDRPVANDGGQRRVGSGWGRSAPLDLKDWQLQAEDYRTVGKVLVDEEPDDGLVWINADLTPAYTNAHSGKGEFFARTRRVERYFRTVAYLRDPDLILVHDRLRFSRTSLRSRWLLHTQNAINIDGRRFSTRAGAGALRGEVLLPRDATVQSVGGAGLEFFVATRNYDQNGKAQRSAAKRAGIEPGAWRLEVQSGEGSRELSYLVALAPSVGEMPGAMPRISVNEYDGALHVVVEGVRREIRLPQGLEAISSRAP